MYIVKKGIFDVCIKYKSGEIRKIIVFGMKMDRYEGLAKVRR